jgi:hypothetical protein
MVGGGELDQESDLDSILKLLTQRKRSKAKPTSLMSMFGALEATPVSFFIDLMHIDIDIVIDMYMHVAFLIRVLSAQSTLLFHLAPSKFCPNTKAGRTKCYL